MNNCGIATMSDANQQMIITRRTRRRAVHERNGQQIASYLLEEKKTQIFKNDKTIV